MAKTHGGLFSLEASGTVASTITFSKWKGRQYVRVTVVPHNPRSGLQTGMRSAMKFLTQGWKLISGASQTTWDAAAKSAKISPFNSYVGMNQARARQGQGFTEVDPPVPAAGEAAPTAGSAAAGVKELILAWTDSAGANDWGTFVFMSTTTGFPPSISNLIQVVPHGIMTYTVPRLITGTPYFFRLAGTDKAGNLGALLAQFTGTPA
jgi:hypothetical protein